MNAIDDQVLGRHRLRELQRTIGTIEERTVRRVAARSIRAPAPRLAHVRRTLLRELGRELGTDEERGAA